MSDRLSSFGKLLNYLNKFNCNYFYFINFFSIKIDEENLPVLFNLVENHFKTVEQLQRNRNLNRFRSSIVPLIVVNRLIQKLSDDPNILNEDHEPVSSPIAKLSFSNAAFLISKFLSHKQKVLSRKQRMIIRESCEFKQKIKGYEEKSIALAPSIENRILRIQNEEVSLFYH